MAQMTTTELNNVADTEKARFVAISLHTADPSTTGASEATGGSPAYARKSLSFGSAASGVAAATTVTFDVPAGTYTHFGLWSATTAGTYRGGGALSASQTLGAQGTVQVTFSLTATAS